MAGEKVVKYEVPRGHYFGGSNHCRARYISMAAPRRQERWALVLALGEAVVCVRRSNAGLFNVKTYVQKSRNLTSGSGAQGHFTRCAKVQTCCRFVCGWLAYDPLRDVTDDFARSQASHMPYSERLSSLDEDFWPDE
ncbi:unnamed protein product [Symbiodinium sp. CCMP2592]|nr:unnamed protein product [Symbiodinium sp. CCMP2592]